MEWWSRWKRDLGWKWYLLLWRNRTVFLIQLYHNKCILLPNLLTIYINQVYHKKINQVYQHYKIVYHYQTYRQYIGRWYHIIISTLSEVLTNQWLTNLSIKYNNINYIKYISRAHQVYQQYKWLRDWLVHQIYHVIK